MNHLKNDEPLPPGILDETDLVDADPFVTTSIAQDLRAARSAAGLTKAELAGRLNQSETLVQAVEQGTLEASPEYVDAVLRACAP